MKRLLSIGLLALLLGFSPRANARSCAGAQGIQNIYWRDRNTGHPAAAAKVMSENEWAFRGACTSGYSYGEYDRDRHWHNLHWWVDHDRNWVQQHHPNWITEREHHDNDHGHDHEQGHGPQ